MNRYSGAWVLAHLEKKSGFLATLSAAHSLRGACTLLQQHLWYLLRALLAWQGLCRAPGLSTQKSNGHIALHAIKQSIRIRQSICDPMLPAEELWIVLGWRDMGRSPTS
jgi:hypothetical protein